MTLTLHNSQVHYSGCMQWWACSSADWSIVVPYCVIMTWQQTMRIH